MSNLQVTFCAALLLTACSGPMLEEGRYELQVSIEENSCEPFELDLAAGLLLDIEVVEDDVWSAIELTHDVAFTGYFQGGGAIAFGTQSAALDDGGLRYSDWYAELYPASDVDFRGLMSIEVQTQGVIEALCSARLEVAGISSVDGG